MFKFHVGRNGNLIFFWHENAQKIQIETILISLKKSANKTI